MEQFTYHNIFETKGIEYVLTIIFFLLLIPFWLILRRKDEVASAVSQQMDSLSEKLLQIPRGLLYSKNHLWTYMQKNGRIKMGIDEFLAHVTGNVNVHFLKSPGMEVKKGEPLAEVEQNGKKLQLFAPISGTISKVNDEVLDHPSLLKLEPYDSGWLFSVEPSNWKAESNTFYFAHEASDWFKKEIHRFKDFLATSFAGMQTGGMAVALQEGGEIKEDVLSEMPEDTWENFQKDFLNN